MINEKISKEELDEILEKHEKFLKGYSSGERASLAGADLRDADLRYADLRHADLRNANLAGVNLRYADLRNANLTGAIIFDTNFASVRGKNVISIQLNTSIENRVINYIPDIDWVSAGCFHGTLEELKSKVEDIHKDNKKIQKKYKKAIKLIEFLKEDYGND